MSQVIFAPEADNDLIEIAAFFARDKPDAARHWVQGLRETCQVLASHPESGEDRPDFGVSGCRCFSVGVYIVFFRPIAGGIEIARIIHGNRDLRNL